MSKKIFALGALAVGGYFAAPYIAGAVTGAAGGTSFLVPGAAQAAAAGGFTSAVPGVVGTAAGGLPAWLSPALTIAGGGFNAYSQYQQGEMLKRAGEQDQAVANAQAASLEQNAGQTRAQAQQAAIEQKRRVGLLSSRARAVAAAGGTSTTDPGVVDAISDLDAEAEYRFRTALATGESQAQGMEFAAATKRAGGSDAAAVGEMQRRSSYLRATVAGTAGALTLAQKYG